MSEIKVAFQGELGAYSHIASLEYFKNPKVKACSTFEETFKTAFEDNSYKIIIQKKEVIVNLLKIRYQKRQTCDLVVLLVCLVLHHYHLMNHLMLLLHHT